MTQAAVLKGVFIAVPLVLLALRALPLGWALRLPLGLGLGLAAGLGIAAWLPQGILAYLVSFSIMAGIYAILSLGLNCPVPSKPRDRVALDL